MTTQQPSETMKTEVPAAQEKQALLGVAVSTKKMVLACILGYLMPGAGHIILGRFTRGIIFMIVIFTMFVLGFAMDGHMFYPIRTDAFTAFPSFANIGIGLSYFICFIMKFGFGVPEVSAATFEPGNTFLWTAGLLNYLVVMDAYDIAVGRKS